MKLLAALLTLLAFILAGFSWTCIVYYSVFGAVSWWLIHLFLYNKYELDFEVIFKLFEWFGYGTPHFLEGKGDSPSENTTDEQDSVCRIPEPIAKSVDKLIENVSRDFVASWYREVADGDVFVDESKAALKKLSLEIYQRMTQLDSHYLTEQVIVVFHAHLERFNKSVSVLKDKDPKLKLSISSSQLLHQTYESQIQSKHIALTNPSSELNYLRTVVDSLLAALLPSNIFSCDTGRFILREILAVQLVELVNLLTDPDWVNEAIIDLFCPPRSQLSDVLGTQNKSDQTNTDQAIKKHVGSIEKSKSTLITRISSGGGLPEGEAKHISFEDQFSPEQVGKEKVEEGQERTDSTMVDDTITSKEIENNILQGENMLLLGNSCNSNLNGNIKRFSGSFNQNPSSFECMQRERTESKISGLSSSWGFLPSSEDKTFQTQSFEAMKQQAIERERLKNKSKKLEQFGCEMKKLSSCCTKFEVSDEMDRKQKGKFAKIRSRTVSFPGELPIVTNRKDAKNEMFLNQYKGFQRSVSFPSDISSVLDKRESLDHKERPLRSSTIDPIPVYGSPYYNISFCSSDGSFKSFSDDDIDVEEGEEMDEGSDSDSSEVLEDIAPLPIMKPPKKGERTGELETDSAGDNISGKGNLYNEKTWQRKLGYAKSRAFIKDNHFEGGSTEITGSTEDSNYGKNSFDGYYDNRYKSNGSKDSDLSDPRSPLETVPNSRRLESDSSFGDSVLLAGRKFISSIKSPVKKFGFSSGSSKSTSTSSGADSMEVNVPSSIDTASFDSDLPLYRPVQKTKTDSPSSGRKLSRSNAVTDMSSESETETYGTPVAPVKEEIVYGVASSSSGDITDSDNKAVIKIHPSQLISIPSSETALESDLEPGRNKFTLYRIEYDIRIWPNLYKAIMEEEEENKPENEEEDEDSSIKKKNIPHKRIIKRRYREFMELHSRLQNGPMAMYMKDILKPNRRYNLPFGRLDKDVVEGRRCLLQYYLVSLVSKPELRDSDQVKQFLGLIGGVSFIKPSVAQIMSQSVHAVPRVNKMLSKQMTKVIDSIKTAFEIEGQEDQIETVKSDAVDSSCPWSVVHHSSLDEQLVMDENHLAPGDCFSAFLENLEHQLSTTSKWRKHSSDTDDTCDDSSDYDNDDDDDDDLHLLGPRTAGDGSDTPNEPSTASSISKDDMLNGVLGSKPPGLCVPHTLTHSVSSGSINDKDTVDFGKQWFKKDSSEKQHTPVAEAAPEMSAQDELIDPQNEHHKVQFPHQLKFSMKNVEKLKCAAKKAKEKKIESVENLGHVKDKFKAFSKEKKIESLEGLSHAKDKVKAFSKEKKIEPLENLSHAKDKVKAFSKEKKIEPLENLSHAKDKVKAFSKEKKIESLESLSNAKDKVKTFSKEKKLESVESLGHAKDKVKSFKKKIPNPKKLLKKGHFPHFSKIEGKQEELYTPSFLMELKETCKSPVQDIKITRKRPDQPLDMSSTDDPSHCITEITQDISAEDIQCPLSHVILDLTCEVLRGHDSWTTIDRVQEGFLGIFGALFEWFVRGEIDDLFTDDCWGLYLENLVEVIWPNGKLIKPSGKEKSEEEKEKNKKEAIKTLMEFFPDIFPLFIGSRIFKDCASNAVESLQNPAINRILIYILLEIFLPEVVPEIQGNIYIEGQESHE